MSDLTIKAPDWNLLREQKESLLYAIYEDEESGNSDRADFLQGILHFIDHIQDTAVESGKWSEEDVFGG